MILEARSNGTPTPAQQSEDHIQSTLPDGTAVQPSYKNGKPASYGSRGSVRPDFAAQGGMVTWEVKNYNLATNSANLVNNVAKQAIARAAKLPSGATQNVMIDTTGQTTTKAQQDAIAARITQKSGGVIATDKVRFFSRRN